MKYNIVDLMHCILLNIYNRIEHSSWSTQYPIISLYPILLSDYANYT